MPDNRGGDVTRRTSTDALVERLRAELRRRERQLAKYEAEAGALAKVAALREPLAGLTRRQRDTLDRFLVAVASAVLLSDSTPQKEPERRPTGNPGSGGYNPTPVWFANRVEAVFDVLHREAQALEVFAERPYPVARKTKPRPLKCRECGERFNPPGGNFCPQCAAPLPPLPGMATE